MTDLDQQLRALDAARPVTSEQRARALSTLDRIVAGPPLSLPPQPRRRRLPRWARMAATQLPQWAHPTITRNPPWARVSITRLSRWAGLAAVAAAAVVAGAVIVFPGALGGRAYASWTPVPAPLTGAEIALIGPACVDGLGGSPQFDGSRAQVVLAERRGEYAMLLYRIDDPATAASCLVHNVPGSDDVDDPTWGLASGSDTAWAIPPGSFTEGAIFDFRKASVIEGTAGEGVTGVTVHAGDITAQATVADGRYVVWWPGPAFTDDADGDPVLNLTYDLTLAGGRVITGAPPHRPR